MQFSVIQYTEIMYDEGYKYWLAYKTNSTCYYRCCRYASSKCPGRCINENGNIRRTTEHNHPPEPDRALVDKFRKVLTQRAAAENTELYAIYCDEATCRHSDAAMLYPFESAKSAMRKARRKQLPQAPSTVNDIVDVLETSDLFRVNSGADKDSIYQKTVHLEDSICMMFLHRKTVELFGRIDEIHVDGTVEFAPDTPPGYYLITVHAVQGPITAPVVYALLTAKTPSAYAAFFAYIREELDILPTMIVSDFNHMMQTSLSYTFPEAVVKGCWFHYTDTVLTQMKCLNLERETHKGTGASALRMLLVLPLLPAEYMGPGLESLKKWMKEKNILSESLARLCDYIEQSWLRAIGAEKMSIFGTTRGVSNHLKNFNKELATLLEGENPAIWIILESLTQLATKTFVKVSKKMRAFKADHGKSSVSNRCNKSNTGRVQRKSEQFTDAIISSATQLWIKTPVHLRNPLQFLQLSSHCISETSCLANLVGVRSVFSCKSETFHRSYDKIQQQPTWDQLNNKQYHAEPLHENPSVQYFQHDNMQNNQNNQIGAIIELDRISVNATHCISIMNDTISEQYEGVQSAASSSYNLSAMECSRSTVSQVRTPISSDPPPLAFFPNVKRVASKRRLPLLSEPPPLVPISSKCSNK